MAGLAVNLVMQQIRGQVADSDLAKEQESAVDGALDFAEADFDRIRLELSQVAQSIALDGDIGQDLKLLSSRPTRLPSRAVRRGA